MTAGQHSINKPQSNVIIVQLSDNVIKKDVHENK